MMEYYYISSCSSSNKKQLDRLLRRSPTTTTDDDDGDALAAAASTAPSHARGKGEKSSSTEMLMRMAASASAAAIASGGAPPRRRRPPALSSFGVWSGVWSVGDCPPTPSSPFCSPLASSPASSSSAAGGDDDFVTPYQSLRIVSCDAQRSHASREKEEEEEEEIEERKMAANYGSFKKLLHPKKLQVAINPSRMHNKTRACSWDSDSEGTYYTGSSGGGGGGGSSEYENLGSESWAQQRPGRSRRRPCFSARSIKSQVEAKLLAWKEARISKLANKLRKKVAAINEWEQQQITKAKQDMKELEMKLEKRRTMAAEDMQWRIMIAHEKAAKKKMEQQATAAMKISNVDHTFEDISNNKKLPWRLFFLCSSMHV